MSHLYLFAFRDLVAINDQKLKTYVALNLLPDRSEAGFRETKVVKDKDPKYNQEYVMTIRIIMV